MYTTYRQYRKPRVLEANVQSASVVVRLGAAVALKGPSPVQRCFFAVQNLLRNQTCCHDFLLFQPTRRAGRELDQWESLLGEIVRDLQQFFRKVFPDMSSHILVQSLPRNGVGFVGTVACAINGLVEVDRHVLPRFPFAETVFKLHGIVSFQSPQINSGSSENVRWYTRGQSMGGGLDQTSLGQWLQDSWSRQRMLV